MTWWMWTLAYLGTGLLLSPVFSRMAWWDEWKSAQKKGYIDRVECVQWDNNDAGLITALSLVFWPLALVIVAAAGVGHLAQPLIQFLYTPAVVRKARKALQAQGGELD